MTKTHLKKPFLYATAAIVSLFVLLSLLLVVEYHRTQFESTKVLSAFFSRVVLRNTDDAAPLHTITIVIMRNPACPICKEPPLGPGSGSWFTQSLKSRKSTLADRWWFSQTSKITRASFFLNSVFSGNINTNLRLPSGTNAVFIDQSDLGNKVGDFEAKFPHSSGYFVVSHVGLNLKKDEALIYVEHLCSGLCGGGEYVLLRKTNGIWQVVDIHDTWMS
jgi:hypothetical protein